MGVPPKSNFSSIAAQLRAKLEIQKANLKRTRTPDATASPAAPLILPILKKLKVSPSHPTSPRSFRASPPVSGAMSPLYKKAASPRKLMPNSFSGTSKVIFSPAEVSSDSNLIDSSNISINDSMITSSDVESVKKIQLLLPKKIVQLDATDSNSSDSSEDASSSQSESEDQNYISLSSKANDSDITSRKQPWFCSEIYSNSLSATERLNKEVESFVEYISPTDKEIELRKWVFSHVKIAANQLWPSSTVHMFGSFSTRLFIPTSDIDIVIIIPELDPTCLVSALTSLRSTINKSISFSKSEIRKNAKIPIINFVEQITGLEVDVNINASSGIDSCHIVTDFIRQCPAIRPLNMILKHFLELNDLNKVFTGGLSSYALTLLVVNFLQIHPFVRSGQIDPMSNLGVLLVEFLELYGICFNSNLVGITLTNGGRYYRRSSLAQFRNQFKSVSLELLDPQDESNNVASGSFNFESVKTSFRKAYVSISDTAARYSSNNREASFLESLLGQMIYIPISTIRIRENLKKAYDQIFMAQQSDMS